MSNQEPEIHVVKRLKSIKTTHTALSAINGLQRFFGDAMQWFGGLARKFNFTEKAVLAVLITMIVGGSVGLALSRENSSELQPATGGAHIEGMIGQPQSINPLLAGTNSVDRDISRLVYSGLTKIGAGREVLPDLSTGWDVLDNGKTYIFQLQPNAKWHDGQPFSADDVVFTFNVLQNNDYNGVLKTDFTGILVEKVSDFAVKITLPMSSVFFLTDVSFGIIPAHIFQDIPVKDLAASYTTSKIIGTGPYQYQNFKDGALTLKRFEDYYGTKPYLESIVFSFFDNAENLYAALRNRQVSAAGFTEPVFSDTSSSDNKYEFALPQYKAIFFNQLSGNALLQNATIRQALAYATNKQQIIDEVEQGYAVQVDSPILPGFWGNNPNLKKYEFDIAKAASLLKRDGWTDSDKDGILDKNNGKTRLSLKISFRDDAKSRRTAELVQQNWKSIGAEAILLPLDATTLVKDIIRPRAYEVLIFGQDLGGNSDPYVYWHSSQITDPGLALAPTVDKDIDNNLEQARTAASLSKAIPYYLKFQSAFADLVPAILLYQPKYTYLADKKVKGVTDKINLSSTADRFIDIGKWYVKSHRE
ncbi:MAG: peptide ABC transporter substrate-binding protein [Patescibacteria group bacterium]|jgi:peptide/nickel transport system substrate-binding protein